MKDREERAKKHGCDGICYTPTSMCPCAETCPETRTKEGLATIAAVICYILMILLIPVIMIVLWVGLWVIAYGAADFFMGLLGLL